MIRKITVIYKEEGYQESYIGFLTDPDHAMYVGSQYGTLFLGKVSPTEQDGCYTVDESFIVLGHLTEGQEEHTIKTLSQVLREKSAYDFLTEIMLRVPEEIEFKDLIVPGLIKIN
jgi:hypothetical protein